MKTKFIFLILLFLIPFGCKEDKKIEIIQTDQVYFQLNEIDEFSEFFNKSTEKTKKTIIGLEDTIKTIFNSFDENEKKTFIVDYRVLINENGKVDKVQIIKSNYPKIDRIFADAIGTINFDPQFREGKKVKYTFPWRYSYEYFSNNNNTNLIYENNVFFVGVEEMPEPIGGIQSIQSKIKYPEKAKQMGVEGKVYIVAYVDETGNVTDAKIIKGIGAGCDQAAIDAIKQTKFTPGKQKGKPVKVQVSIPIIFKLESKITIEEILNKFKWNINQAEVIRVASNYLKVTDYKELKQKNSRSRVIQFTGGSLSGIKTNSWSFAFENDKLDFIVIKINSSSSSVKAENFKLLKNEIEKLSNKKLGGFR